MKAHRCVGGGEGVSKTQGWWHKTLDASVKVQYTQGSDDPKASPLERFESHKPSWCRALVSVMPQNYWSFLQSVVKVEQTLNT